MVSDPAKPTRNVKKIRELAQHDKLVMVRVAPLFTQVAIDDPKHYPIYQVCEELGLPVGINVGVPGPRVRSRVQHPELLEDVMIDFPDLRIIGAHMGHPYEELLMNYMRKWDNLYLSCTAYAPRYFDPALVRFMGSSRGRGRVLWGSDDPWFPMARSITEARALDLDDDARTRFLGTAARTLLSRSDR
jgi:predicted TIM-barrel fold metal-dependent hydrolase